MYLTKLKLYEIYSRKSKYIFKAQLIVYLLPISSDLLISVPVLKTLNIALLRPTRAICNTHLIHLFKVQYKI